MELNECTNRQMRYKGNCKQCGKEVYSYYKSQLPTFCSHKCSNQWKWDNIRERKKYIILKSGMIKLHYNDIFMVSLLVLNVKKYIIFFGGEYYERFNIGCIGSRYG